jgi:hypothetical protein
VAEPATTMSVWRKGPYEKQLLCVDCNSSLKTVEDFESTWKSLLDKYGLEGNDWLEAVYNARKQCLLS